MKSHRRGSAPGAPSRGAATEDPSTDQLTTWLIEEARSVQERTHSLVMNDERMLATGFALLGSGSIVAVANDHGEILIGMPIPLAFLLCFSQYQHSLVLALGAYGAELERQVNGRASATVLAWESVVAPRLHRSASVVIVRLFAAAFYLISCVVSVRLSFAETAFGGFGRRHATLLVLMDMVVVTAMSVTVIAAGLLARREYQRVTNIVTDGVFTTAPIPP